MPLDIVDFSRESFIQCYLVSVRILPCKTCCSLHQNKMATSLIVITLLTLIPLLLLNYIKKFFYWKNKNVPGPKPMPIVGNFGSIIMLKESITMLTSKLYSCYSNEKAVGVYQGSSPMLILRDPELIKDVLIKDFSYFNDRGTKVSNDILSDNLFNAEVDSWRKLRHGFTPMFSSGKLKSMSPLIQTCVEEFQNYIDKLVDENVPQEMRILTSKYTLEVIGSCAFGLKLDAFTNEDNIFRDIAETIFKPRWKSTFFRSLDAILPGIVKYLNISIANERITIFFQDLVKRVVKEREGQSMVRKDFMDLLIELRRKYIDTESVNEALNLKVTDDVMAAQALVFYAAGFETSSGAMSFFLYELALKKECQDKVHQEIDIVIKKHGGITYDAVCEMNYLEMAFDETLRKHPPAGVLARRTVTDYTFSKTKLKINKDVRVLIPVYGLHHDPNYFEKPDEFIPERFSQENRRDIRPCTFLPFGDGPRNCIGTRFAKIESMMGLAGFLQKFKVEVSEKTSVPIVYDARSITMKSRDGIWLNIKRR